MDSTVSVIVTAYNAERYLETALTSIEKQTYSDFEAIVVVDGATDNTLNIAKKYAETDKRFKVIARENGGHSVAKNTGIDNAKGKYITFVDSDDYISETHLEKLVNGMMGSQLSVCGIVNETEDKQVLDIIDVGTGTYDKYELLDRLLISENQIGGYNCNKLYWLDIIRENHLRFPDGNYYYEDIFFSYHYIKHISSGACVGESTYHYVHYHDAGMTRALGNPEKWLHYVDVFDMILDENDTDYIDFLKKVKLQKVWHSATAVRTLAHFNCEQNTEYKRMRTYIGQNLFPYFRCKNLPLQKRLGGILTYWMPKTAFRLWNAKRS